MPAGMAPHKQGAEDPGAGHRLAMCRLLTRSDARLEVSTLELDRLGPSYTIDTLRALGRLAPDARLTLIMGSDTACTLPTWREPFEVLRLARLAIAERDMQRRESVLQALSSLDGLAQLVFIDMPPVDISSSAVRSFVTEGEPVEGLVGSEVARYIAAHNLYKTDAHTIEEDVSR